MDIKKIEELAKILKQNQLTKLDLAEGDVRLVLEAASEIKAVPAAVAEGVCEERAVLEAAEEKETPVLDLHEVKSPLVGTAYLASQAGAEPFVSVGGCIKAGEAVCIVESMKMFNTIEADISGVIEEIAVDNGQVVEYGQVLVRIRKED